MQWDMITRGHGFYLESRARSSHFNFSRFRPSVGLRFYSGRLFASNRSRHWSVWRRLCYTLVSPLIPVVRFVRILKVANNTESGRLLYLLPTLLGLLVLDGLGEMVGYATGSGDSMRKLSGFGEFERIRFLNVSDQRLLIRK